MTKPNGDDVARVAWPEGGDAHQAKIIAETIERLPANVAAYVVGNVQFVVRHQRSCWAMQAAGWVVFLDDDAFRDQSVIAHELAHAWHKHGPYADIEDLARKEHEACETAAAWGFKGLGTWPEVQASAGIADLMRRLGVAQIVSSEADNESISFWELRAAEYSRELEDSLTARQRRLIELRDEALCKARNYGAKRV